MARSDLVLVPIEACSEFGLGARFKPVDRGIGATVRRLCARHAEAERTGEWPSEPRWLAKTAGEA